MKVIPRPRPVEWIYLAGGIVLLFRYFWFMDDAFVYFRYIDNWLFLRIGLVYNQGEFVEGFSSPLWTLLLSGFRITGLSYLTIIRSIGVASFVLFWFLLVRLNRRMSPDTAVMNFPLVYLGFTYGVLSYFSSGVAAPLVQVVAVAYALFFVVPSSRPLQIVLALSPLLRHEMVLPLVLGMLWWWRTEKRFPTIMLLTFLITMGGWMTFRIYYYADLFPNPFYLKDTFYIGQGVKYLNNTLVTYNFYIVAAVFVVLVILLRKTKIPLLLDRRIMMLIAAASVAAYVVRIGGDARHYRYLAFSFPLAVCASSGILEHAVSVLGRSLRGWLLPVAGLALAALFALAYPPQLDKHPIFSDVDGSVIDGISDAAGHRVKPMTHYRIWGPRVTVEGLRAYRDRHAKFGYMRVASGGWCVDNYMRFDHRIVQSYGLTDAILARTALTSVRAAHKHRLKPLARDLVAIYTSAEPIGRGMFSQAVERGTAPAWVEANMEAVQVIERKIFNRHNFFENLRLAFTFPPKIQP